MYLVHGWHWKIFNIFLEKGGRYSTPGPLSVNPPLMAAGKYQYDI